MTIKYDTDARAIGDWGHVWPQTLHEFARSAPPYSLTQVLSWAITDTIKYKWPALKFAESWMDKHPDKWHE